MSDDKKDVYSDPVADMVAEKGDATQKPQAPAAPPPPPPASTAPPTPAPVPQAQPTPPAPAPAAPPPQQAAAPAPTQAVPPAPAPTTPAAPATTPATPPTPAPAAPQAQPPKPTAPAPQPATPAPMPQQPATPPPSPTQPAATPPQPTAPAQPTQPAPGPSVGDLMPELAEDAPSGSREKAPQRPNHMPIGELLIGKGLISRDQLDIALKIQRDGDDKSMLGSIMVRLGFITESALSEVLSEHSDVERFDAGQTIIDPYLVKQVPKDIVERYEAVPILLKDDKVYIAMVDIYNVLAIDQLQRHFPKSLRLMPVHCSESELSEIVNKYFDYDLSIDGILREIETLQKDPGALDKLASESAEGGSYTNPTVRLLDALLVDAIHEGASDLHFEPEGTFVRLRYRVDGKLRLVRSFHKDYWSAIVVRVKILSGMNITEARQPQDGRITKMILGREVAFRVATQPTVHGENLVLRVLDKKKALLPIEMLGYSEHNRDLLAKALQRPEGIIVVTGPTGSGKTTTLYSILSEINTSDVNIMTLEDPVEYQLPMIRQSNVREGSGMDFSSGIKSLMRQDPDIIFVGEVRDKETATMALRASMTGHQVYTSLHTNDALGIIPRLVDVGLKPNMLAGSIIAGIAQRLARRLCSSCKQEHTPDEKERKILGIEEGEEVTIYKHNGCSKCNNTGYKGRIALTEIILVDEGLDELIYSSASRAKMVDYLRNNGFKSMVDDGILKIQEGIMDVDELIRTVNVIDRL